MDNKWKKAIEKEFKNCIEAFPEIEEEVKLIIKITKDELSGAMAHYENQKFIILFMPELFKDKPKALRPIMFHELSHIISKGTKACERVFFERADKRSQELWTLIKKHDKDLICEDYRNG